MTIFKLPKLQMSTKYKAREPNACYFITITTVGWVDVFTRLGQKYIIIDALAYCQKEKGLELYAYCLMHSHIHLLCRAKEGCRLSDIVRDLKKFTSKKIIATIREEPESRREWLLPFFSKACAHLKRKQGFKVWKDGYHAEIAYSNAFIKQKINYIHNNSVKDKIVEFPEHYVFSSARNYAGLDYELYVDVQSDLLL